MVVQSKLLQPKIQSTKCFLSFRRKRKSSSISLSLSASGTINNQTKFVISYIIPGGHDMTNNISRTVNQQQHKQFQKKYNHLFRVSTIDDMHKHFIYLSHPLRQSPVHQATSPTTNHRFFLSSFSLSTTILCQILTHAHAFIFS